MATLSRHKTKRSSFKQLILDCDAKILVICLKKYMYKIKAVDIKTTATMCVTSIYITKHYANYIVSLENETEQYPSWKEFTVH